MDDKKNVEITTQDDVTVVSFNEVSMGCLADLEGVSRVIVSLIESDKPAKMVVDFTRVKFFSSQTLGLLLHIRQRMKTYDAQVVISGINPQLYRVFRITNLDKIFSFYPDAESAVKGMDNAESIRDD